MKRVKKQRDGGTVNKYGSKYLEIQSEFQFI